MSYESFYGLKEQAFSNAPDGRFYFESSQHSEAMVRMLHALDGMKGLIVMVGDIGAGKTLLARKALEKLEEDSQYEATLLVIIHSEISAEWILRKVAQQFGVENIGSTKAEIISQLYERLMQLYENGKKAVVLIDEANMLQKKEIFEEFRGLLNLEVPGRKLISIVLLGLPELDQFLVLDPALQQRVAVKFALKSLTRETTEQYIKHRLLIAGCIKEIFTQAAFQAIFEYTTGTPRLINTICDNAMLESYLLKRELIDSDIINQVAGDLGLHKES
jgi:type II secretory pathway predicted ATPase ExeA